MRSGRAPKREIEPDPIYNSVLVTKLINQVMRDGKKSTARRVVYKAFEQIEKQTGQNLLQVFETAVNNVAPRMEVRPRRVGGASYQVPVEVRGDRRISLALRWLVMGARSRPNSQYHTFSEKLAAELIDASQGTGTAVKKKEDIQRQAEANRAFAHFRW